MKKFNKNSLLFVFFLIFVIAGIAGTCFWEIGTETVGLAIDLYHRDPHSITEYKEQVDSISSKSLNYHNILLDINGLKNNLLGTQIIYKNDTTVVKSASGSLTVPAPKVEQADIVRTVTEINRLYQVCLENDAKFLYFCAPTKQLTEKLPDNVDNYAAENYKNFLAEMDNHKIPYLRFEKNTAEPCFYNSDHHWTARTGFEATTVLCETLHTQYGFTYNQNYTNIDNYNITLYENYFLGSYGKKVGTYFSGCGADDFELITPKFDTQFTETQPQKNQVRTGAFEDTVLYMDNMKKDYYNANPYAVYSGGDFRLQVIKNEQNPDGAKVLIVRDSFACAVTPFLALHTGELHICDTRNYSYYSGQKINIESYIQEIQPDYVIVLYTDVLSFEAASGRFDFF